MKQEARGHNLPEVPKLENGEVPCHPPFPMGVAVSTSLQAVASGKILISSFFGTETVIFWNTLGLFVLQIFCCG